MQSSDSACRPWKESNWSLRCPPAIKQSCCCFMGVSTAAQTGGQSLKNAQTAQVRSQSATNMCQMLKSTCKCSHQDQSFACSQRLLASQNHKLPLCMFTCVLFAPCVCNVRLPHSSTHVQFNLHPIGVKAFTCHTCKININYRSYSHCITFLGLYTSSDSNADT